MRRVGKKLSARMIAFVVAGCLFLTGADVNMALASAETKEEVLFEEDFETGGVGDWTGREGAELSIVSENPGNGSYCMKISGRTAPFSGAKLQIGNLLKKNQRLTVTAYARYAQGPETKRVQMTLACGGKYYVLGGSELPRGEWGKITGSMIIPDDIALDNAELYFETPCTPEPSEEQDLMDIYVDDIRATLRPFSDFSSYPSLKELYKDQFLVGVAAAEGTINTSVYSDFINRQFNSMTMENEMKPAYILDEAASKEDLTSHRERAALNFRAYETGMEYARQHGIIVRGHTLVWHSQTPEWFFYENYDTSGELADRELMLKRMENYIKDVIAWTETNYPGVIYAWDVVNEAAADPWGENADNLLRQEGSLWYQTIGDDFVQKAFAYARKYTKEYAPDHKIKLFYNDYNEYFSVKRDRIVEILTPVKEAGNIDGMGMQSHFDTKLPLEGPDGYMTAVRTFRDQLGLELHVTELDIGIAEGHTEEDQGAYYQEFMEALLKEKKDGANITCVTFWGISDELSWRPDENCLLFQGDLSIKPAFTGVVNAIGGTGAAIDKIKAIGTVELTETCKGKIDEAKAAYIALTDAQKELVPAEFLKALEDAETEYGRLYEEAQKPPVSEAISLDKATVSAIPAQIYTGKAITPSVTVTCNGKNLVKDRDYTVSCSNNINIGTATVTISGKGGYSGKVTKSFAITVKKNKVYTVGDYKYKITNAKTDGKGTVAVTGVKSSAVKKKLKKINVLSMVNIGGKKFKVTEIGRNAFSGCRKATSATIGSNVGRIGTKSFYNCKKLKSITIKTSKLTSKSVGAKAFKGIHAKAAIKAPKKKVAVYKKFLSIS